MSWCIAKQQFVERNIVIDHERNALRTLLASVLFKNKHFFHSLTEYLGNVHGQL